MQALYDVPAPAKINLFLHVLGQRPDGYHLIQSVFTMVDWCDTLHFELRQDGQLTREDLGTPLPPDDLVLRAARALQQATGCLLGAHIGVLKRIPAQAGLGGGSSDAASTLLALNRLWKLRLRRAELEQMGAALGADIPFFLRGQTAWVEGIGEQITPLLPEQCPPHTTYLIAKPDAGIDTKSIFSSKLLKRDTKPATIQVFAAMHDEFGCNDLQSVACKAEAKVEKALEWLTQQGLSARMTGSGSAVFAKISHNALVPAPYQGLQVKKCESLNIHPLRDWVSN